ncbi:hypothetical protein [Staphylospora marina]|nr:hypothetical protein [Staphylospora marina]
MPSEIAMMLKELSVCVASVFTAWLVIEFLEYKGWIRFHREDD